MRYGVINLGMHKIDLLGDDRGSESEASTFRPVRCSSRDLVNSHSKGSRFRLLAGVSGVYLNIRNAIILFPKSLQ